MICWAAATNWSACERVSFLPRWAFTSDTNESISRHASRTSPRNHSRCACASSRSSARPGRVPDTCDINDAICSPAPATCTVKLDDAVLPAPSVATNVTVVSPTGNTDPDAGPTVRVSVTPGQLSDTAGGR
jgi:hypothetical protein